MATDPKGNGRSRSTRQDKSECIDATSKNMPSDGIIQLPDWHVRELEKRVAAADANPGVGKPWEELHARLSRKQ